MNHDEIVQEIRKIKASDKPEFLDRYNSFQRGLINWIKSELEEALENEAKAREEYKQVLDEYDIKLETIDGDKFITVQGKRLVQVFNDDLSLFADHFEEMKQQINAKEEEIKLILKDFESQDMSDKDFKQVLKELSLVVDDKLDKSIQIASDIKKLQSENGLFKKILNKSKIKSLEKEKDSLGYDLDEKRLKAMKLLPEVVWKIKTIKMLDEGGVPEKAKAVKDALAMVAQLERSLESNRREEETLLLKRDAIARTFEFIKLYKENESAFANAKKSLHTLFTEQLKNDYNDFEKEFKNWSKAYDMSKQLVEGQGKEFESLPADQQFTYYEDKMIDIQDVKKQGFDIEL